jgi:hypothetical protein
MMQRSSEQAVTPAPWRLLVQDEVVKYCRVQLALGALQPGGAAVQEIWDLISADLSDSKFQWWVTPHPPPACRQPLLLCAALHLLCGAVLCCATPCWAALYSVLCTAQYSVPYGSGDHAWLVG